MYSKEEKLAAVLQIANIEQIQHALTNGDDGAEQKARDLIELVANLDNGLMLIVTGIGSVLHFIAKENENEEVQ